MAHQGSPVPPTPSRSVLLAESQQAPRGPAALTILQGQLPVLLLHLLQLLFLPVERERDGVPQNTAIHMILCRGTQSMSRLYVGTLAKPQLVLCACVCEALSGTRPFLLSQSLGTVHF